RGGLDRAGSRLPAAQRIRRGQRPPRPLALDPRHPEAPRRGYELHPVGISSYLDLFGAARQRVCRAQKPHLLRSTSLRHLRRGRLHLRPVEARHLRALQASALSARRPLRGQAGGLRRYLLLSSLLERRRGALAFRALYLERGERILPRPDLLGCQAADPPRRPPVLVSAKARPREGKRGGVRSNDARVGLTIPRPAVDLFRFCAGFRSPRRSL